MGLLDSVGRDCVDVREVIEDNDGKVVVDLEMFSSELYKASDYRMVWLSFPVDYDSDFNKYYSNLWELYDFLDYHPDVSEHTRIYVVRYFSTTFVHPNPAYRGDVKYRAMVGVVLDVRSRYYALRALYGIYRFIIRYCGRDRRLDDMTVYWKIPKDEHHYEDYEYNYDIKDDLFLQFDKYMSGEKVEKTAYDLAGFIYDGSKGRMREDWHKKLSVKCSRRYQRDFWGEMLVKDF